MFTLPKLSEIISDIVRTRPDGSYVVTYNHETYGPVPYHVPNEGEWTELFAELDAWAKKNTSKLMDEEAYKVKRLADIEAAKTDDDIAAEVRAKRNALLDATDKYMTLDYPISDEKRDALRTYRQALRDIPQQQGFPRNVTWPEMPAI